MGDDTRFVDLHAHLLWGLDDGPRQMGESLALARRAVEDNIGVVAATCHQRGVFHANDAEAIRHRTCELAERLSEANIDLSLLPSAEWMVDADTAEHLRDFLPSLLTLGDLGRYALLEFPFQFPSYLPLVRRSLDDAGIIPVLAHIEKYRALLDNPARVQGLLDEGYVTQMNADSVTGKFGPRVMNSCRYLVQKGLVHLIASDAHSSDRRPPMMTHAYENVVRWAGEETAHLLFRVNPRAVLAGESVTRPHPMSWLARLRHR